MAAAEPGRKRRGPMSEVTIDRKTRDALYEAALSELGGIDDVRLLLEHRDGSWVEARDMARRMRQCFHLLDLIRWQADPGDDEYLFQIDGVDRGELILLLAYFQNAAGGELAEFGDEETRLAHA